MVSIKKNHKTEAKGIHILTLCEGISDKSLILQKKLEDVKKRREIVLMERDLELRQILLLGKTKDHIQNLHLVTSVMLHSLWEEYRYYLDILHKLFKKREFVIENITCTVGRSVLAQRLSGTVTYTGTVTHTALGTNATPATVGDATLGTETYRKALSSGTYASNIAYLETFYSASEVSGTFQEYGMFIDGTGAANSGQLFNRFLSAVTKSVTETLNVQSIVTFNDS